MSDTEENLNEEEEYEEEEYASDEEIEEIEREENEENEENEEIIENEEDENNIEEESTSYGEENEFSEAREEEGQLSNLAPRVFSDDPKSKDKNHYGAPLKTIKDLKTYIAGMGKLAKFQKIIEQRSLTDAERFNVMIDILLDMYEYPANISVEIMSLVPKIEGLKYKSPVGILFGFMSIVDGHIDINTVEELVAAHGEREAINMFDIIRYSKYLLSLNKKINYIKDYMINNP